MEKLVYHYNFIRNIFIQDLIEKDHKDFYPETIIDGIKYDKIKFNDTNREIFYE
jgi:hypothetical protein